MDNLEYFVFFSTVKITKGHNQSIIIDFQRNFSMTIPNDLAVFVESINKKSKSIIEKKYLKLKESKDEYINFLIENEFGFFTNNPKNFPELNNIFQLPEVVSNAIIEYNNQNYSINDALYKLSNIKCKNIELFLKNNVKLNNLFNVLDYINKQELNFWNISIFINHEENKEEVDYRKLLDNKRISFMVVYNFKYDKKILNSESILCFTTQNLNNRNTCGIFNEDIFSINIQHYTESLNHNSCLHKKISIDVDGNIRNCPSMPQSFGNIKDTTLEEALNHLDFKKYWNVTKDMIAVCKDCEFRHICTDCRAYTERTHFGEDIDLSKPLKCGYNPYTNEWVEWSTNPLKEKAIEYYGMQDLVKKDGL
jgi:SPASM domain peptide maturase of grasp-with-spasm system